LGATPSTVGKETPKGVLEILESGNFTPDWYSEHREEIVKAREKTFS